MRNKIIALSWEYIEDACLNIAHQIKQDEFLPDLILPVLWGGAIPSRILIDMMNWPRTICYPITARSYCSMKQAQSLFVDINLNFNMEDPQNKKVLIIEEIIDTGNTMKYTISKLIESGFKENNIEVASIAYRSSCQRIPDYWHIEVKNEWVVFPWDKREYIREIESK